MCTKEYIPLHGFTKRAAAYTNPASACGQRRSVQGDPPSWTMKALLSEGIAVTVLAQGQLPPRMVSEVLGLRDPTHTNPHAEILLHSPWQFKPLPPCRARMLTKQFVRLLLDKQLRRQIPKCENAISCTLSLLWGKRSFVIYLFFLILISLNVHFHIYGLT